MVGPDSHGVSRVPCYLGDRSSLPRPFHLRDYHPLWFNFPEDSATDSVCNRPCALHRAATGSLNPPHENACRLYSMRGLGYSRFARHYSGNPFRFLFLRLLRCFSSPGVASVALRRRISRHYSGWVSPFGDPRIKACLRLPEAYRSLPRPSSPIAAKASTVSP